MASTFFGLNIGASALNSFQAAINTTANNVSNVQTKGYSRQNANLAATDAMRVVAKYGSVGTGVEVTSIKQERDLYYDSKYWANNSNVGYYEKKLYYMDQLETVFADDDITEGFSTIFNKMFNALDSLKSDNASDVNYRKQFVGSAESLCTYFSAVYQSLYEMQDDCNEEIKSQVDAINSIGTKIALLNKEINQIEIGTGAYANELRDERANLIDQLSSYVEVETREYEVINTYGDNLGGTNFTLYINGQQMVDGYESRQLECKASEYKQYECDIEGKYSIVWADTKTAFAATSGVADGSLKALFDFRDGDNASNLTGSLAEVKKVNNANGTFSYDLKLQTDGKTINTAFNALNIASKDGVIEIQNRIFNYDDFSITTDDEGNITELVFHLNEESSKKVDASPLTLGSRVITGNGVDSMGVPYYMGQINEFIRNFSEMFNKIETQADSTGKVPVDLYGNPAEAFFVSTTPTGKVYKMSNGYPLKDVSSDPEKSGTTNADGSYNGTYYNLTAKTYTVNDKIARDPGKFATTTDETSAGAYEVVERLLKLQSDTVVFRGDKASSFLETLISDTSVDAEKAQIYYDNYSGLAKTIQNQRTSVSGVDEDEEALNLIKFQNAYNLASKVISVMSELYDKLINQTGVT